MIESGKPNPALREKLDSLQIRRRLLKTIAGAEIADRADAEDKARREFKKLEKEEQAAMVAREKKAQDERDDRRLFEMHNKLSGAWGENNPNVQKFLQIAQGMRNGGYGPQTPAEKKLFLQGRSVLEPNNVRVKNELTSILKNEQRIKDAKNKIKGFFSRTKDAQETSPQDVPQKPKGVSSPKGDTSTAAQADSVLKSALNAVDKGVAVDKLGESKRENALQQITMLLKQETNIDKEKDLEGWINRELLEVYGSDKKSRERAVKAIKQAVQNDAKGQYANIARIWAGKAKETPPSDADKPSIGDTIEDAKKKIEEVTEDEQKQDRKDATDAFIKNMKGWDGKPIDVKKIDGWDEKKFNQVLGLLIKDINNAKTLKDAKVWGRDVYDNLVFFAAQRSQEEKRNLEVRLAQITEQVQELTAKLSSRDEEMDLLRQEVENIKKQRAEKPAQESKHSQGVPPQVQRPVGFDMPGQTGQVNYNYNYPPQGAPWPPQYTQYQAPPAGPTFGGNPNAPRPEPAAAQGPANPETKPKDTTKPEANENTKNPAQQAAEDMRAAMEGKIPSSIESLLMQKRGETPMWKRVRNAVGLMAIGGIAGATFVSTAGVPALLAAGLAGSQFATFATILTGIGAGLSAGLVSGGVKGGIEVRSAIKYAKESAPNKYVSWNEIFTHVFRKSLVGAGFGAVGGGIGASVMDAYGDQIRAGAGALGDWANKEVADFKNGAKDLLSGLWGTDVVPLSDASSSVSECTTNEAVLAAMSAKIDGLQDGLAIKEGIARIKLNNLADIIIQQGVTLDSIKEALNGTQTQIQELNNFVSALSAEQKASFSELFNNYGNTAYYFFQNNIVLPDAALVAESVPASSVPEVTPAPDVAPAVDAAASAATEAVNLTDQNIIDSFKQAVTNGGVWTGTGNVLEAAGITPEMGTVGGTDILSYLTDVFEDYTQDGTAPGTKATSYFRQLGEGLLDKISNQTGATQVTLKGDLNMEHLFGNEDIQKDALRRISENPAMSADVKEKIMPLIEKIFANAKVALSK